MEYKFISVNSILLKDNRLMNVLYEYGLLNGKLTLDAKKIITYYFIDEVNQIIKDKSVFIYHNHLIVEYCPLLTYFPEKDLSNFINKLCAKIKKLTRRLIFTRLDKIPHNVKIKDIDGEIKDEIILLNNQKPEHPKKLLEFLKEYNLGELFNSFAIHLQ